MSNKLVSVIIPAYNRARLLIRAVNSILSQTYAHLELIIIDDCSTDNTQELISSLTDKRIIYLRLSKNKGLAGAYNTGLNLTRGEYVAFLDDDDEWLPDKLKFQLEVFDSGKFQNLGLVYTNSYAIEDNQKNLLIAKNNISKITYGARERKSNIFPGRIETAPPPTWLLPKKIINDVGLFEERLKCRTDADYSVRVGYKYDFYFLNSPLVVKHVQPVRLTALSMERIEDRLVFFNIHYPKMIKDRKYLCSYYLTWAKDWLKVGEKKKARQYFLKALKVNPFNIRILGKLAKLYK